MPEAGISFAVAGLTLPGSADGGYYIFDIGVQRGYFLTCLVVVHPGGVTAGSAGNYQLFRSMVWRRYKLA